MDTYKQIDKQIFDATKNLPPLLLYFEAINQDEQKKLFLKDKIEEPTFKYSDEELENSDLDKRAKTLSEIEIPNTPLGELYRGMIQQKIAALKLRKYRGYRAQVISESILFFGAPDLTLRDEALRIIKTNQKNTDKKTISTEDAQEFLIQKLKDYGLNDWTVEIMDKKIVTVYKSLRIGIPKGRKFSQRELERLSIHEIGVHVLRTVNGMKQPIELFQNGTTDYNFTEEGLTTYFEEKTGYLDPHLLRNYAGRFIAVLSILDGKSFMDTYKELRSLDFNKNDAWTITVRAHRGGGLIKDHIYLQGYLKIKNYAANNPDWKTLYAGKIAIEDLPVVKDLLDKGEIKEAEVMPEFI